jgi:hypothetical protein
LRDETTSTLISGAVTYKIYGVRVRVRVRFRFRVKVKVTVGPSSATLKLTDLRTDLARDFLLFASVVVVLMPWAGAGGGGGGGGGGVGGGGEEDTWEVGADGGEGLGLFSSLSPSESSRAGSSPSNCILFATAPSGTPALSIDMNFCGT